MNAHQTDQAAEMTGGKKAEADHEEVGDAKRRAWNQALLRYCELDTLAMAMIIQGWRAWL